MPSWLFRDPFVEKPRLVSRTASDKVEMERSVAYRVPDRYRERIKELFLAMGGSESWGAAQ
jgi:hypothetical protein